MTGFLLKRSLQLLAQMASIILYEIKTIVKLWDQILHLEGTAKIMFHHKPMP